MYSMTTRVDIYSKKNRITDNAIQIKFNSNLFVWHFYCHKAASQNYINSGYTF